MVTHPKDPEREPFAGLLLRHRGRTGLTQQVLSARLGTSRRSIQDWESGASYPTAERLQVLIQLLRESGGLTVGRERAEVHALWAAVLREAPRMHTPLDEVWLDGVLAERAAPATAELAGDVRAGEAGSAERSQDWGEAPDVIGFVGRAEELKTLRDWVLEERCRLAAVLGMGGIGKTALASRLAQGAAPSFQRVYWRSLRDALPAGEWMAGAIGFLSAHRVVPRQGESARLLVLLQLLRDQPSLLVLDNFETVFEPGQDEGRYRDGLAGYGELLRAIGETRHQSCLVVTSREAPPELAVLSGGGVRELHLGGLGVPEGQVLLAEKQLSGSEEDWANLIARFGGNGLALKVVGESIRQVFDGEITTFLGQAGSGSIFGGMRRLLAEQIERSSTLEQNVLRALAVEREPRTLAELVADLGPRVEQRAALAAVEALRRRSLVERAGTAGKAAFTLQSVVLEYVTDRLVEEVSDEIAHGRPLRLVKQPLIKAQAKDYIRDSQERLIGEPILQLLKADLGDGEVEQRLLGLLEGWRNVSYADQGYGPGNAVNLLRLARGDLRCLDLTRLALRQAYLAGVEAQDTSLADANLSEAQLAEAFNFPFSVALSGDGALMAAGTSEGEVWLWRVADRTPLLAVQGHIGAIYGLALSADGRLLASGGMDGTVRLWSVTDEPVGRLLTTLEGHTGGVNRLALSVDGERLVSCVFDGTVRLWEVSTARLLATLEGHTSAVVAAGLSDDGRLLASGSWDGTIRLWSLETAETCTGELLATLSPPTGPVFGVALSGDGRLLAAGGMAGTVQLWDVPSRQPLATLHGHTAGVYGVALSADGRLLVSSSEDATVRMWEVPSGRPLATLQGHSGPVYGLALSPDGALVASGSEDATVRVWETGTRRLVAALQGLTSGIWDAALSADGQLLVSGSFDGNVRLWETSTGRLLGTLRGHARGVWAVVVSEDGRLLASGGVDGTVRLWSASSGQELATLQAHAGPVYGVAMDAPGRLLASSGQDGTLRLWDVPDRKLLATLQEHTNLVWAVALSADGRLLASGSLDGSVRLWDVPNRQLLTTLDSHTGPVYGVALSADGRLLASGSQDATIRLTDTGTGQLQGVLRGHTGGVLGVALSGDGRLLGSSSQDGTVRVWETTTGEVLALLEGHTGGIRGVALSTDGRLLASGGQDGTLRLWDPSRGACVRILRSDRRYERMDITGLSGVTSAQRVALLALGAVDHVDRS
jgi:WD40 repeat protein/transcriptional regulator with XRE-family HTH domain